MVEKDSDSIISKKKHHSLWLDFNKWLFYFFQDQMILVTYKSCNKYQEKDLQTKLQRSLQNEVVKLGEVMHFVPPAVILLCSSTLWVWSQHDGMLVLCSRDTEQ